MSEETEQPAIQSAISIAGIDPVGLLGPADANLRAIAGHYRTRIVVRTGTIRLSGPASEKEEITRLFNRLLSRCRQGQIVNPQLVEAEIRDCRLKQEIARSQNPTGKSRPAARGRPAAAEARARKNNLLTVQTPRKTIVAKNPNQQAYLKAIADNDVVFAIGPAGTGKTYLAVAAAVEALTQGRCSRIVLTRPAVEAGESLGYLPGTFKDKVDPYLRPLYDALFDMMSLERARRLIEEEIVEVAPLAYMRGRTLSEAYVILDEAQNTTPIQMKMLLTRLGWNSKTVITGDVTQIDLAQSQLSGLVHAEARLKGVEGIAIARFTEKDVVRPPLVSRIITAYDRMTKKESKHRSTRSTKRKATTTEDEAG